MKQKFSMQWKASKQPRKQRKYAAKAPLHVKHKILSANLSKDLRKKHAKRSMPIRKGDSVRVMRGEFKGKTGKIESVDLKRTRVMIEGIYRTKKDGSKVGVYFNPSNIQVRDLNLDDKKRIKSIERAKKKESKSLKEEKANAPEKK
jgi:large subunit ribosomal protein L24